MESKKLITNRSVELDVLRVIATLLVVIGHCFFYTTSGKLDGGINYVSLLNQSNLEDTVIHRSIGIISSLIYTFHMALFFSLSGLIYGICKNKNRYPTFKKIIIDKTKRLVIPYLLVSLLFSVPILFITGYFGDQNYVYKIFVGYMLGYGTNHLWFIIALFYIFIIIWILDRYVSSFMVKSLIIFSLLLFNNFFSIEFLYVDKALEYITWFYLGCIFTPYYTLVNNIIQKHYSEVIIGTFFTWISTFLIVQRLYNSWLMEYIIAFFGIAFFYSISVIIAQKHGLVIAKNKIFQIINKYSFEIYLYGTPINYIVLSVAVTYAGVSILSSEIGSIFIIAFRFLLQIIIPIFVAKVINIYRGHFSSSSSLDT